MAAVPETAERAGRGRRGLPPPAAGVPLRRRPAERPDPGPAALRAAVGRHFPQRLGADGGLDPHHGLYGNRRRDRVLHRVHAAGEIPAGIQGQLAGRGDRMRGGGHPLRRGLHGPAGSGEQAPGAGRYRAHFYHELNGPEYQPGHGGGPENGGAGAGHPPGDPGRQDVYLPDDAAEGGIRWRRRDEIRRHLDSLYHAGRPGPCPALSAAVFRLPAAGYQHL